MVEQRALVVAPHPDDEVLGVGGTILNLKRKGTQVGWLLITAMLTEHGWSKEVVEEKHKQIKEVEKSFGFDAFYSLNHPTTKLDQIPKRDLVADISSVFSEFKPSDIFVPHHADAHSDHRVVFEAVSSCTKWFRHDYISNVYAYETLSETGFGLPTGNGFTPNMYFNIEASLQKKLDIMQTYASELGEHPFPRSVEAIQSLAALRGSESGFSAAEAFQLLRARIR